MFASHFDEVEHDRELAKILFEIIASDSDMDLSHLVKVGTIRAFDDWGRHASNDFAYGYDWTRGGVDPFSVVLSGPHDNPAAAGAAVVFGAVAPSCFLSHLHQRHQSRRPPLPHWAVDEALGGTLRALHSNYYGEMGCPGFLDYASKGQLAAEFEQMGPLLETAADLCTDDILIQRIMSFYEALRPPRSRCPRRHRVCLTLTR